MDLSFDSGNRTHQTAWLYSVIVCTRWTKKLFNIIPKQLWQVQISTIIFFSATLTVKSRVQFFILVNHLQLSQITCTIASKKNGISNFCQFWKIRSSSNFIVIFFYTIPADILKIYFILLFSFSKCPLILIKVDFDFTLNKYSLRAYLQSFPTTYCREQ
jgi:hypothetical protein